MMRRGQNVKQDESGQVQVLPENSAGSGGSPGRHRERMMSSLGTGEREGSIAVTVEKPHPRNTGLPLSPGFLGHIHLLKHR